MCVFLVLTMKKEKDAGAQGASAAPSQKPGTWRLLPGCFVLQRVCQKQCGKAEESLP